MIRDRMVNLSDKNIRDFTENDTIYVSKLHGGKRGQQVVYFCKFLRLDRGNVVAKVVSMDNLLNAHYKPDEEIVARLDKCYLWGRKPNDLVQWEHANWFKKDGYAN